LAILPGDLPAEVERRQLTKGACYLLGFTTKPKTRRKLKYPTISVNRSIAFMEHCFYLGLKEASYQTIKYEFEEAWPGCDQRTLIKYIGRPQMTIHSDGGTLIRQKVDTGTTAIFRYLNDRMPEAKQGLLEKLGYLKRLSEGNGLEARFKFNYEPFNFSKEQDTLKPTISLQEGTDSSASKDNFSVSSIEHSLVVVKDSITGSIKDLLGPSMRGGEDEGGKEKKKKV
jgi:hypothetical protein